MFGSLKFSVLFLQYWYCFYGINLLTYSSSVCHGLVVWQLTYVPRANFTKTTYGNVISLASFSDITCALASNKMRWPHLSCFQNGTCLMTKYQTTPRSTSEGITDPVECMTKMREYDCDMGNGTVISNGTTWDFNCGQQMCFHGNIVPTGSFTPPSFATPKACTFPFSKIVGFGCGAYFDTKLAFCNARKYCFAKGADLINLGRLENRTRLTTFAKSQTGTNDFWVGLESLTGNDIYTWDLGGVVTPSDQIWDSSPSSKSTWQCAFAKSSSGDTWALKQEDYTKDLYVACEIPNAT